MVASREEDSLLFYHKPNPVGRVSDVINHGSSGDAALDASVDTDAHGNASQAAAGGGSAGTHAAQGCAIADIVTCDTSANDGAQDNVPTAAVDASRSSGDSSGADESGSVAADTTAAARFSDGAAAGAAQVEAFERMRFRWWRPRASEV